VNAQGSLVKSAKNGARTGARRLCALASAAVSVVALHGAALAAEDDGLYGRFDGDVTLHLGAGMALAAGGPALAARIEALYLSTAGIYGHYTDALGSEAPSVERSIAAGLRLQPFFLGRFGKDLEQGPARLDLLVDSFAFEMGAFWDALRGSSLGGDPGLELALSIELPMLEDATGPFLGVRGGLRWRATDLRSSAADSGLLDQGALLSLTLAWHHVVTGHIVDASDRLKR
jgi:hypothetical protein